MSVDNDIMCNEVIGWEVLCCMTVIYLLFLAPHIVSWSNKVLKLKLDHFSGLISRQNWLILLMFGLWFSLGLIIGNMPNN